MTDDNSFVIIEEGDPIHGIKKTKEELQAEREAAREQQVEFSNALDQ